MAFRLHMDSGFSLVETMVATLIFAMVSTAGVMILSGYQDGRLALASADERLAQLELAKATLSADLLHATFRPVRDELGGRSHSFEGGDNLPEGVKLKLIRGGAPKALFDGERSALERVEYLVVDGNLVRRSHARTDITPNTPVMEQRVLAGVEGLSLRFEAEGQWANEWRGGNLGVSLPNLVEMTFEFANKRSLSLTMMVGGKA